MDEGAYYIVILVPNGTHSNKVDIDSTYHVSPRSSCMLFCEPLIANARYNELVFPRLAAIDVIVSVKKASIVDHKGHLVALVHDLVVTVPVNGLDLYFLVVGGQNDHLVTEIVDKLVWHHVLHLHFANVQSRPISLPHLVLHKIVFVVSGDNGNVSLAGQKMECFLEK